MQLLLQRAQPWPALVSSSVHYWACGYLRSQELPLRKVAALCEHSFSKLSVVRHAQRLTCVGRHAGGRPGPNCMYQAQLSMPLQSRADESQRVVLVRTFALRAKSSAV